MPCHPCGVAMDYVRDCYRSVMHAWQGSDEEVPVRWFRAAPDANFFEGSSLLRSSYWHDREEEIPPVGDVPPRRYGRGLCEDTWCFAGRKFCGPREALLDGGRPGVDPPLELELDGGAVCCERVMCGHGGEGIGGTGFGAAFLEPCCGSFEVPSTLYYRLTDISAGLFGPPDRPGLNLSGTLHRGPTDQFWLGAISTPEIVPLYLNCRHIFAGFDWYLCTAGSNHVGEVCMTDRVFASCSPYKLVGRMLVLVAPTTFGRAWAVISSSPIPAGPVQLGGHSGPAVGGEAEQSGAYPPLIAVGGAAVGGEAEQGGGAILFATGGAAVGGEAEQGGAGGLFATGGAAVGGEALQAGSAILSATGGAAVGGEAEQGGA